MVFENRKSEDFPVFRIPSSPKIHSFSDSIRI